MAEVHGRDTGRRPFTIRMDDAEYGWLTDLAEEWGLSLAGAIRRLIRENRRKEG